MTNPKDINPFPDTDHSAPKDLPPLTIMSLSLRTIVNHKENKREIVCGTLRVWENGESLRCRHGCLTNVVATVNIDDPTPPEKQPCSVHTVVRPLDRFPAGFENKARSERSKIVTVKNEKFLLNNMIGQCSRSLSWSLLLNHSSHRPPV